MWGLVDDGTNTKKYINLAKIKQYTGKVDEKNGFSVAMNTR